MATEVLTSVPHIERLKNILGVASLSSETSSSGLRPKAWTHTLNEREGVDVEYYSKNRSHERELIVCSITRDNKVVLGFSIGEKGLESLGAGNLRLTFGNSKAVSIGPVLGVSFRSSLHPMYVDEAGWTDFQGLAGEVVNFVEETVKNGKVAEVPFRILAANEKVISEQWKDLAKDMIRGIFQKAVDFGHMPRGGNEYLTEAKGMVDFAVGSGILSYEECMEVQKEFTSRILEVTSSD